LAVAAPDALGTEIRAAACRAVGPARAPAAATLPAVRPAATALEVRPFAADFAAGLVRPPLALSFEAFGAAFAFAAGARALGGAGWPLTPEAGAPIPRGEATRFENGRTVPGRAAGRVTAPTLGAGRRASRGRADDGPRTPG
jgi:hypothetical protein